MPKNKYKLQTVLDVRERAKRDAMALVAARRAQLAEAEAELARRELSVARCRDRQRTAQEKMMEDVRRGIEAQTVVAHRAHLADLRRLEEELIAEVERQRPVVERAESELEKALAGLIEASKELQTIEKHREGWQHQTRRREARREEKLSDEIGAIIHERKRSRDES